MLDMENHVPGLPDRRGERGLRQVAIRTDDRNPLADHRGPGSAHADVTPEKRTGRSAATSSKLSRRAETTNQRPRNLVMDRLPLANCRRATALEIAWARAVTKFDARQPANGHASPRGGLARVLRAHGISPELVAGLIEADMATMQLEHRTARRHEIECGVSGSHSPRLRPHFLVYP
jgi:hypothetical protein